MQQNPPAKWIIVLILVFFAALCISLIILIYRLWPPEIIYVPRLLKNITDEQRLILLVALCGALGAFIHMTTSFTDYLGSRKLESSWIAWYLMRPLVGATLALSFYFLLRGGLVSVNASAPTDYMETRDSITYVYKDTSKGQLNGQIFKSNSNAVKGFEKIAEEKMPRKPFNLPVNPFGVAAIAILSGLFSRQAVDKLKDIFENIFTTKDKVNRTDSLDNNATSENSENGKDDDYDDEKETQPNSIVKE